MTRFAAKIIRIMRCRTCDTCSYGLNNYCNVHSVEIVDRGGCDLWLGLKQFKRIHPGALSHVLSVVAPCVERADDGGTQIRIGKTLVPSASADSRNHVLGDDARSRIVEWLLCKLHLIFKWLIRKLEGEKYEQLHK